MASVGFAVFAAVLMRSFQLGSYDNMIENVVGQFTGYEQIHAEGYWQEQTLENSFEQPADTALEGYAPRIESFALAALGQKSRGAIVVGLDPDREIPGLRLGERVKQGTLFGAGDRAVVLGEGLADYLGAKVGDSLVMLSQGYHAVSSTGLYPVAGIVSLGSPELSKNLLFMPLEEARWFYGMEGRLTTLVAHRPHAESAASLPFTADVALEVLPWQEVLPDLDQAIRFDSLGGKIFLSVLYLVIMFGLFGTVLMMTHERTREFGVLIAIGMSRRLLSAVAVMESILLALFGGVLGWALIYPLTIWLNRHPLRLTGELERASLEYGFEPILPTSTDLSIGFWQMFIVVSMAIFCSTYAIFAVYRNQPVNSMRG